MLLHLNEYYLFPCPKTVQLHSQRADFVVYQICSLTEQPEIV